MLFANPTDPVEGLLIPLLQRIPLAASLLRLEKEDDSRTLRVLFANEAAPPMGPFIGRTLWEVVPGVYDTSLPDQCIEALQSGQQIQLGESKPEIEAIPPALHFTWAIPVDGKVLLLLNDLPHRMSDRGEGPLPGYRELETALAEKQAECSVLQDRIRTLTSDLESRVLARTALLTLQGEKLEKANQDLEQFAYMAAHDLQEPMRMVISFTELLQRRYDGRLGGDADEFIGIAMDGAKRMTRLIDDLLLYCRSGQEGIRETVVLDSVLFDVLTIVRTGLKESGAVFTHDPLPILPGVRVELVQLFQNLLSNALKFRRRDVVSRIHLSVTEGSEQWLFEMRDNGIGIAEGDQEKIFETFKRLHSRSSFPGSGIGLSLVRKIVQRHGGTLGVSSVEGEGSTFRFTLDR